MLASASDSGAARSTLNWRVAKSRFRREASVQTAPADDRDKQTSKFNGWLPSHLRLFHPPQFREQRSRAALDEKPSSPPLRPPGPAAASTYRSCDRAGSTTRGAERSSYETDSSRVRVAGLVPAAAHSPVWSPTLQVRTLRWIVVPAKEMLSAIEPV